VPSAPAPERPPRGPLVLVAEDEFLIAMELELLLGRHGYRVLGPAATVAGRCGCWRPRRRTRRCST